MGNPTRGCRLRVTSLAEFMLYFGLLDPTTGQPLPELQQYRPIYYPSPAKSPQDR